MDVKSNLHTHLFVRRIQQIMANYQLDATQFAQHIQVDPILFGKLLALEPVDAEVVLSVIDQFHYELKLSFDWFLTYDLDVIPDLSDHLSTLLTDQNVVPQRLKTPRQLALEMVWDIIIETTLDMADNKKAH